MDLLPKQHPESKAQSVKTYPTGLTNFSSSSHFNPAEKLTTYCEGHHWASLEEEFKEMFTAGLVNLLTFL